MSSRWSPQGPAQGGDAVCSASPWASAPFLSSLAHPRVGSAGRTLGPWSGQGWAGALSYFRRVLGDPGTKDPQVPVGGRRSPEPTAHS